MVGQRRISISPLVGGIRKWELVLIIWWNYLYQWLKFHWKITGGSKYQKIEMPRRSDLPRSTYLHNTFIGNRKTGALGVIIIYGSLGTLKDRWNIWTFGIKVYSKHKLTFKLCLHTLQYKLQNLRGILFLLAYWTSKILQCYNYCEFEFIPHINTSFEKWKSSQSPFIRKHTYQRLSQHMLDILKLFLCAIIVCNRMKIYCTSENIERNIRCYLLLAIKRNLIQGCISVTTEWRIENFTSIGLTCSFLKCQIMTWVVYNMIKLHLKRVRL
jgi:hypothetical protein